MGKVSAAKPQVVRRVIMHADIDNTLPSPYREGFLESINLSGNRFGFANRFGKDNAYQHFDKNYYPHTHTRARARVFNLMIKKSLSFSLIP